MKTSTVTIIALSSLLVFSNGWWIYSTLDQGISLTYLGVSLEDNQTALSQSLFLSKLLGEGRTAKADLVSEMEKKFVITDSFEKEGYVWVGKVGLRFDSRDRFIEARPAWE
jgi:hypothetical protein